MTSDATPPARHANMPNFDSPDAGTRPLLAEEVQRRLPANIATRLRRMGAACNDISIALAAALLDLARYSDRYELDLVNDSDTPPDVTEALIAVTASHADSLTRLYADTAAVYAVCASEALDSAIRRQPINPTEYLHIAAADIFLLPGLHLPLIQMPITDQQSQLHNAALDATHRLLTEAIDQIRRPANIRRDNDRTDAVTIEPRFAVFLHQYATDCIQALSLATDQHE